MIIRTARPARSLVALVWVVLLLAVSVLVPAMPAHAASSIQIEARALVGGRYAVSGWMAISVTLVNDGEPTDGVLATSTDAGNVERYVEMPAGARKVVTLYVQPEAFQRRLTIEYREPNGTVREVVEIRVFEQSSNQVGVVGDGAGNLRPQLTPADARNQPAPLALTLADLPERSEPLDGIHVLVWADDSTALSENQRRSISRWVAEGGELVVVGGPDWQARLGGFEDLLPLEDITAVDDVPQAALAAWAGSEAPPAETATVSTGTLRPDARQLIAAEDGTILASMRNVGGGRVILLGVDAASQQHRTWDGGTRLWSRLLPSNAAFEEFFGGFGGAEEMQNAMGNALSNLPSLEVPPAELLLVVIVAYILLIGPISYVVLRRMDRREMAWITAPVLVIVFTAGSFGIGNSMKGTSIIVNRISVLHTSGIDGTASAEIYAGIFSPDRATYAITAEADALLGRMRSINFQGNEPTSDVILEQGNPARLRNLAIGVFGFEAVRANAIVDHAASLSVSWRSEDGKLIGTVTNVGEETVEDVAFISSSGGDLVERELAPGATAEFSVEQTNFNGSSASDQVYGFGGFDNASEAQRRIIMRRQVIDALVGFGGFAPGMEFGTGTVRGPFVIGWTDDAGPVPIVLDDVTAQEYAQTVEVVSVRPGVGSGEVVIRPAQMSVGLVETEGDAGSQGGGMVSLGEGSATFSIALPLEATEMAVSELEIIVGPDPSVVLSDPGGFGGFWPPGYTMEVRDPETGAWTELGDISQKNRFEIDDPATAVSDAGRIEVRISGSEVDPNFGQVSVFVSAQARGVIGE
ncbi:MAG: hypothetical protein K5924_04330 [Chloroflexi bacterium]|nr:hypothetical protein [Chloroflexota bacterium]